MRLKYHSVQSDIEVVALFPFKSPQKASAVEFSEVLLSIVSSRLKFPEVEYYLMKSRSGCENLLFQQRVACLC